MAQKTIISVLNNYFNQGDGKRPIAAFRNELKDLTPEEKYELACLAQVAMGGEVTDVEVPDGVTPAAA